MRIIPVIDVMGGVVVRAIGGRRSEYRPIRSRLTNSTEPLEVAGALLKLTGSKELYIADLDAICGDGSQAVDPSRFPAAVLFDAGVRDVARLETLNRWPNVRPVVGTETWTVPPDEWPIPFLAVLSLDYFDGKLRTGWLTLSASERGQGGEVSAIVPRVASLIVLDIARVGTGQGSGTENTIREIRFLAPRIELIAGGGVKNRDDLHRLEDAGADAVLVASALHDGSLFGLG